MIQELREQLEIDLRNNSGGNGPPLNVQVYGLWPSKIAPPCAVVGIEPGQYILAGQTFGSFDVLMTVVLLVKRSPTMVTDLETLIENTLANTIDWGMRGVDSPTIFDENGLELLGTTIHLSKQSKL